MCHCELDDVVYYTRMVISPQTLSNADASGEGLSIAYKIGRSVVYNTEQLILWIVGVSRLVKTEKRIM